MGGVKVSGEPLSYQRFHSTQEFNWLVQTSSTTNILLSKRCCEQESIAERAYAKRLCLSPERCTSTVVLSYQRSYELAISAKFIRGWTFSAVDEVHQ